MYYQTTECDDTLMHAHEYLRRQWAQNLDEGDRLAMKLLVDLIWGDIGHSQRVEWGSPRGSAKPRSG